MITLEMRRFVQKRIGTGLRAEYELREQLSRVVSGRAIRIYERDASQLVHYSTQHDWCDACGTYQAKPWTDDPELYDRHPARCNFAFRATPVEE